MFKDCSGDLMVAILRQPTRPPRNTVQYWVARLCAGDLETLNVARECREQISNDNSNMDLSIVDALIAEADGDPDRAIRILRDRDDPDSRTTLFGVIARARGTAKALDANSDRIDAGGAELFTVVGWRNWAGCMAEAGEWERTAERLAGLDGNRSDEPALALIEGIINAQLLLPAETRSLTSDPSFSWASLQARENKRSSPTSARKSVSNLPKWVLRKSKRSNSLNPLPIGSTGFD